jgi:hypothetical protein
VDDVNTSRREVSAIVEVATLCVDVGVDKVMLASNVSEV